MRRVALKGLWWRRGRAALTAFAVVLGVAMVSGTFILTDTINKAFDIDLPGLLLEHERGHLRQRGGQERRQRNRHRARPARSHRVRANGNVAEATGAIFNLNGTRPRRSSSARTASRWARATTGGSASASPRTPSASIP